MLTLSNIVGRSSSLTELLSSASKCFVFLLHSFVPISKSSITFWGTMGWGLAAVFLITATLLRSWEGALFLSGRRPTSILTFSLVLKYAIFFSAVLCFKSNVITALFTSSDQSSTNSLGLHNQHFRSDFQEHTFIKVFKGFSTNDAPSWFQPETGNNIRSLPKFTFMQSGIVTYKFAFCIYFKSYQMIAVTFLLPQNHVRDQSQYRKYQIKFPGREEKGGRQGADAREFCLQHQP